MTIKKTRSLKRNGRVFGWVFLRIFADFFRYMECSVNLLTVLTEPQGTLKIPLYPKSVSRNTRDNP